jgi:hypothetical protein
MPDRISRLTIELAPRLKITAVTQSLFRRTRRDQDKRIRTCQEHDPLDTRRCDLMASLEREVLGVIRNAAAALTDGCASHATGLEFVDAFRRVAYRRLPGRPRIVEDL